MIQRKPIRDAAFCVCRPRLALVAGFVVVVALFGCAAPPQPSIQTRDSTRLVTYGINPDDYNAVANQLADSILMAEKLGAGRVVVMGPMDTSACQYRFDPRRLSDKLQTRLVQSRRLRVMYAADAMQDRDAAQSRYQLMQLQWEKESAVDPEDLRVLGTLADVDLLLFGRVSTQTVTVGDKTEVTYTYNWKLGECESGVLVWSDEKEYTKSGPRINGRFDPSLRRIPLLVAPTAFHAHSARQYPALVNRWKARGYGNAVWNTLEDILYDVDAIEVVTVPPADRGVIEAILAGKAGTLGAKQTSVLARMPNKILVPNMNFFESTTEEVRFGSVRKTTLYHVEIFLSYYALDGAYVNVPVLAKGEARDADLLTATGTAARKATDKLLRRIRYQWENQL